MGTGVAWRQSRLGFTSHNPIVGNILNTGGNLMTHSNLILMAGILVLAFSVGAEAAPTKDVNVVNEPNVNVLNNVDVNITNDETNPVPVTVQNGNNGAAEKELVEIVELDVPGNNTTLDVFTVPNGKRLVITDLIVSNNRIGSPPIPNAEILRDGSVYSRFMVASSSGSGGAGVYQHSYVSGIEFTEGQIVSIRNPGGQNVDPTHWELRGYLKTL